MGSFTTKRPRIRRRPGGAAERPASPDAERVFALGLPDVRALDAEIRTVLEKCVEKLGFVPNVLRAFTLRPRKFPLFRAYSNELMLGESGLSKLEREMIALAVSSINHCRYCLAAHGAAVRELSGNPRLGEEIAHNYRAAALSPRQRAMLDFAAKLTESPDKIVDEDRASLRKATFSDEDIFDICEITGFYNMTNRLASGTELRPNPEYDRMAR